MCCGNTCNAMWSCIFMEGIQKMICYKCPNCGRVYRYREEGYYQCLNCRYPLKKAEDVKTVRHPELNPMLSDNHVIGTVSDPTKPTPKCPTCGSANVSKIGNFNRMLSISFFGLASSKIGKTHKCNNCGTTW